MSAIQFSFPSDREILIEYAVDAPRDLVFRVLTSPDLIPRWWGPRRFKTTVDKMDLKPGGVWRFVHRGPDGNEYAFNGVYKEIVPPKRFVYTFEFEGMPGHVSLETITFEESGGRTKMANRVLFQSMENRDGMFNSGMKDGATETMDRFSELVAEIRKGDAP